MTGRKVPTGIPGLDDLLFGGILRGSCVLVEGAPGTGKTTLGLQFVYQGAAQFGEPGMVITFEEFPEALYRDASNFGWDLKGMEGKGLLRVIATSPHVLVDQIQEPGGLIEQMAREIGAKRILVDSITHFQRLTDDPVRLREIIDGFFNALKRLGLTAFVTKELSEAEGPIPFEAYIADAVIKLYHERVPYAFRRVRYLEILKARGQEHICGAHTFVFTPQGIRVFPFPMAPEQEIVGNPTRRVRTGIEGLDEMLNGGLVEGFCALVAGPPGAGKTTLGLQFLHEGVVNDDPSLFVSLEERLYKIFLTAQAFGFLKDLIERECFRALSFPSAGLDVSDLYAQVRQSIEEMGIKRVVIDGLTDLQANIPDPRQLREYLFALLSLFEQHGITSILTQETSPAEVMPEIDPNISMLIDAVICLRYVEKDGHIKRVLNVLKMRTSAHDMEVREFRIGPRGIVVEGA